MSPVDEESGEPAEPSPAGSSPEEPRRPVRRRGRPPGSGNKPKPEVPTEDVELQEALRDLLETSATQGLFDPLPRGKSPTPTDRLAISHAERITSLESDKSRLQENADAERGRIDSLRDEKGRLQADNARMEERLRVLETTNVIATILAAGGGAILGISERFPEPLPPYLDGVGFCAIMTGLLIQLSPAIRRVLGL